MTGIICVNKDKDITSFGVVAKMRGICSEKKVGHTGTLDPMATGVLPIMLGGATRFLNYLPESNKGYRASFVLGKTTDTLDSTGKVLKESKVCAGAEDVRASLDQFRGTIDQIPPMYSAKSVDGVRLYDLARLGKEIERKPCRVEIKRLALLDYNEKENSYIIDVLCSKGTYIRSLIDDIGKSLGCGATMTGLCRTKAMGFDLEDCYTLEELQDMKNSGDIHKAIISIENLFEGYSRIYVSDAQATRFYNGGALDIKRLKKTPGKNEICTVYSPDNHFLGLGQEQEGELKVLRLLTIRE